MKIMGLGLDSTGNLLFDPVDEDTIINFLVGALERNSDSLRVLSRITAEAASFRGEREREIVDMGDPRVAGWTFLVNSTDPHREDLEKILEPLAKHRGMADLKDPLLYNDEAEDEWFDWLHDNYFVRELEGKEVPQYILILGGPDRVPFRFQSLLDTVANVGRVDFDTLDDLKCYVDKLLRLEKVAEPVVTGEAILFAPDGGLSDPTYFSRKYMVEPLAEYIRSTLGLKAETIVGDAATKADLLDVLSTHNPALVYTASHGLGGTTDPLEDQKRYNGAICCQHEGTLTQDDLFAADDVSLEQPFLEGAVFFQFACFGYGTPSQSDYAHWLEGVPEQYSEKDFVAALPKRLLAHPRGPIAFIGHLDTAFLHGFADVETPHILDRWHARIAPFLKAVNQLLAVQPSGLAMHDMNTRYNICNMLLTSTYDRQRRGRLTWNARLEARFLDTWITRGDAQNYMILGDPAVRLRIPTQQ